MVGSLFSQQRLLCSTELGCSSVSCTSLIRCQAKEAPQGTQNSSRFRPTPWSVGDVDLQAGTALTSGVIFGFLPWSHPNWVNSGREALLPSNPCYITSLVLSCSPVQRSWVQRKEGHLCDRILGPGWKQSVYFPHLCGSIAHLAVTFPGSWAGTSCSNFEVENLQLSYLRF